MYRKIQIEDYKTHFSQTLPQTWSSLIIYLLLKVKHIYYECTISKITLNEIILVMIYIGKLNI